MKIHPVALAVAAAAGGAAVMVVSGASGHTSSAQSKLDSQLLTNQRISQAAVRRANTALNYMGVVRTSTLDNQYGLNKSNPKGVTPLTQVTGAGLGWQTPQIRDGQVTAAKLGDGQVISSKVADGAITQSKLSSKYYSAYVNSAGALERATPGITGVTKSSDGIRTLSTNFDASACAATASVATAGAQRGIAMAMPPAAAGVTVYTYPNSSLGGVDLAFQVTMVC
ncbi:MAG: hypothetical protein ABGX38_01665 [Thermoleophilia bacterium]